MLTVNVVGVDAMTGTTRPLKRTRFWLGVAEKPWPTNVSWQPGNAHCV